MIFQRKYWFLSVMLFLSMSVFAQPKKTLNYRKFDDRWLHFGFTLGMNSADLSTYPVVGAYEKYGLLSLDNKKQPGGQVGIVTTLKLGHPVVRLRFIPTLSFQERVLTYSYLNPDPDSKVKEIVNEERINSVNLDFPLMLQFRTTRYNNFVAYALGGVQYSLDLQSQEKASQNYIDPFIKIKRYDWQGQIGGGLEFFAPYFKFGLELKFSHGFSNIFVKDNTYIAAPIQTLYNRGWFVSLIFEG